jgi:hypothetical protein
VNGLRQDILNKLCALASAPDALESSKQYLADHLRPGIKRGERVLLCFGSYETNSLGFLMEQAVCLCGAFPIRWGPDFRWKGLLQQAFVTRATTVIGPPLLVLGLTKLKTYLRTPLSVRNVVTVSYPCLDWMIDGIASGLDCTCSGCFGIGDTAVVAGFSCDRSGGVHIRSDVYGVDIVNRDGAPTDQIGEMILFPKSNPELRYSMGEQARLVTEDCPCGLPSHRLVDLYPGSHVDVDLINLGQQLHSWTSILDCNLNKGECGLEMELVVFPGEKLPKLPSAAKQIIRPWNPNQDIPFRDSPMEKNLGFFKEID